MNNMYDKESVVDKFLRYVSFETTSSEETHTSPSTESQKELGKVLAKELEELGASKVYFDEEHCYVYARIPSNLDENDKKDKFSNSTVAFIAHMDTSCEASGKDIKTRIVKDYDGEDILLNEEKNIVLSPKTFKELKSYVGKSLIVTDGTTLLGADDKAGIAEIMCMTQVLLQNDDIKHGEIAICFTPDEEIGEGVDNIDLDRLGADYGYTVDGGAIGELEYENFNAASAVVNIHGVSVHPGDAKDKMINASLVAMEFNEMLPKEQRPECTQEYEGFYHLTDMKGQVEYAKLDYIIRDHDKVKFEEKKKFMEDVADKVNKKYGMKVVELEIKDSYYNMREKIEPENMFLIDRVKECMKELDIEYKVQPIRGGTDGAKLSFMGLPCPNICTGGHNYHGRFEYCCVESMEQIVDLLVKIAQVRN